MGCRVQGAERVRSVGSRSVDYGVRGVGVECKI